VVTVTVPPDVPPEAWDAARDAARPFAADIAEQVIRDPGRTAEIIGRGVALAAAAAVEAAAPHIAAAEREQIAVLADRWAAWCLEDPAHPFDSPRRPFAALLRNPPEGTPDGR
jgi:hypothetical protein